MPSIAPEILGTKTVGSATRIPYVLHTTQFVASERKGRMLRSPVLFFASICFTVFNLALKVVHKGMTRRGVPIFLL